MVSEKPWQKDAVLLLVSAIMLSLCTGLMIKMLLDQWLSKPSFATQAFYAFMVGTISFQGVGLFLLTFFLKWYDMNWKEFLGLHVPNWKKTLLWAAGAAVAVIPLTLLLNNLSAWLITYISHPPKEQMVMQVLQQTVGWAQRICFGFAAIVLAPIVEESLFRGILYPFIKQKGYPSLALAGTSLLFAAIHGSLLTFVPLTFLAMMLVILYEQTDVLLAPIVMHSLFNAVNFSLFFILPAK